MLTSNIEKQNTIIDIKVSPVETMSIFLNKETGFVSILRNFNPYTNISTPLLKLEISEEFNQPIILLDSIRNLEISGKFNKPLILLYQS